MECFGQGQAPRVHQWLTQMNETALTSNSNIKTVTLIFLVT